MRQESGGSAGQVDGGGSGAVHGGSDGVVAGEAPVVPIATTPQNPASGVDWVGLLTSDTALNGLRTVLDIGRLVSGAGLLPGAGADVIEFCQDFRLIWSLGEDLPMAAGRDRWDAPQSRRDCGPQQRGGALRLCDTAGSGRADRLGVANPLTPLSVNAMEASARLEADPEPHHDRVRLPGELVLRCMAMKAPPGSPAQKAWVGVFTNSGVNAMGDVFEMLLDLYDIVTLGTGQGQIAKAVARPIGSLIWTILSSKTVQKAFWQAIVDIFGVEGSSKRGF